MVLDKLGSSLKSILKKIARAGTVDKRLIEELVKEIQKALLYADVNVKLVFDLTNKIKERALNEKVPSAVTQKEYLINIVYEELVKFLGEEKKELNLKNKPSKIMFVGLYGSGKCVHGKSNIQLSNGNIIKIEDIYNSHRIENNEESLEDGSVIDISDKNLFVPSFNPSTLKIEDKKVTNLWKLNKNELIEIRLDNGNDFSIKVTPEHLFFVIRNGRVVKIRADEITLDDYISIPREIRSSGKVVSLFEEIEKLNLYVYLNQEEAKEVLLSKNKNLKEICRDLRFKRNYPYFTLNVRTGKIPIGLIEENKYNFLKVKGHKDKKAIIIPTYLTSEFSEFLGYIMGDGSIGKNYIDISNEDPEIIKRVIELSKTLFNLGAIAKRDFRTKKMYRIRINSNTLIEILSIFGLKRGKKGKELKIPQQVLISDENIIKSFIRAYFDCDSSPVKNARYIELISESNILIKQMNLLLRRFGILSAISKKSINNIPYWRLSIKARYAETYVDKIGYLIERKRRIAEDYKRIGIIQGVGNQDMIPLGKLLKELRRKLGFSIGEIQMNAVYSYGRYEESGWMSREHLLKLIAYYCFKEKGIFFDILNKIKVNESLNRSYSNAVLNGLMPFLKEQDIVTMTEERRPKLTDVGKLYLQSINWEASQDLLTNFELIAQSDVCWIPVKEIKSILNDEKVVYDLTVEDNHSFIAEGVIVHNTTTIQKLGKYYQNRGKKVCFLALDVHRPAAIDQLEQLGSKLKIKVFSDRKEKNPVKIYKKFKDELSKFDIVFIDTAGRDALSKELIKEIEDLNKEIKPDERLLVISADIGQAAEKQAKQFHESVNITGVIASKMDGTAKAGGALVACAVSGAKIKFIGTGEKVDDLEEFNPKGFVGRLLGMGDLEALLEKAKFAIDEEKAEDLGKKFLKGEFNFLDLYEQMSAMKKLGPLNKILDMIPGMGNLNIPKEMMDVQEEKLEKWKHILSSMTKKELEDPEIIDSSRIERIAKGSGTTTHEVRELLKQYRQAKKLMKVMKGKDPSKLMKKFKGKFPGF